MRSIRNIAKIIIIALSVLSAQNMDVYSEVKEDISEMIKNEDYKVRMDALVLASKRMKDKNTFDVFLAGLKDENIQVVQKALEILGLTRKFKEENEKKITSALMDLFGKEKEISVKNAAVLALANRNDPRVTPFLKNILDGGNGNEDMAGSAIAGLLKRIKTKEDCADVESYCMKYIEHGNADVRKTAVESLSGISMASAHLNDVLGHLKDDSRDVRLSVIKALMYIESDKVKNSLIDALTDSDPEVRNNAIVALAVKKYDSPIKEAFMGRLIDKKETPDNKQLIIRISAYKESTDEGKADILRIVFDSGDFWLCGAALDSVFIQEDEIIMPFILRAFDNENSDLRSSAVRAMASRKNKEIILPLLAESLEDEDTFVVIDTVNTLGILNASDNEEINKKITDLLYHEDAKVKISALNLLEKSAKYKDLVFQGFLDLLNSDDIRSVSEVLRNIRKMGKEASKIAFSGLNTDIFSRYLDRKELSKYGEKELLEILKGGDKIKKISAIFALTNIMGKNLFPYLKELIRNEKDDSVLISALKSIAKPEIKGRSDIFKSVINGDRYSEKVKISAMIELSRMAEKSNIPVFLEAIKSKEPRIRSWAFKGLLNSRNFIGKKQLKDLFLSFIKDESDEIRKIAVQNTVLIDDLESREEILKIAMNDKNKNIKRTAISIMEYIQTESSSRTIAEALNDNDKNIVSKALEELIRRKEKGSLPKIAELLNYDDGIIKERAMYALYLFGTKDYLKNAEDMLLQEQNHNIRLYAIKYIGKYGGKSELIFLFGYMKDKKDLNGEIKEWLIKAANIIYDSLDKEEKDSLKIDKEIKARFMKKEGK